jgi:hypothetical protein
MRVFLDANIIFSAAKTDGAIRRLLFMLDSAGHALIADEYVLAEATRNLATRSVEIAKALHRLLPRIEVAAFQRSELGLELAKLPPEKDQPVLAAAIRLQCDALLTGDRTHFGALYGRSIGGVWIHSPRSLAEALRFI